MTATHRPRLPRDYWRQWSASTISNLGDGINFVAMPLLALSLTDDARLLALVAASVLLPWLLLALPVGVLVDRHDRKRLMVSANLLRVVLFGVIAVAAGKGWATIPLLCTLLLAIGACEVVFDSSAQAFLPQIVAAPGLARANGLLFAAEVVAGSIAGLSIGAVLFDLDVAVPFVVNAATFLVAAVLIASIRVTHRQQSGPPSASPVADAGLLSGARWLAAHPLLRALAIMFTITNLGLMFSQGVFAKYAVYELGLTNTEFGVLLAITSMGAATGGLIGHRVLSAIGLRPSVLVPYAVFGLGNLVIGLTSIVWLVAATGFMLGAAITVWNVVTVTLRQQLIPAAQFGRVNGVYRWLGAAASVVGITLGGVVAETWNVRSTFVIGGAIAVVAGVALARPVLRGLSPTQREP